MKTDSKFIQQLWELAGEIGTMGETDDRYAAVYEKLSEALHITEEQKLITFDELE